MEEKLKIYLTPLAIIIADFTIGIFIYKGLELLALEISTDLFHLIGQAKAWVYGKYKRRVRVTVNDFLDWIGSGQKS